MNRVIWTVLAVLGPAVAGQAQVFTYNFGGGVIPDDQPSGGLSVQVTVPPDVTSIAGIAVNLAISGAGASGIAYDGDFYAYLRHDAGAEGTGFAVLLNRVGATLVNPFGYDDNGMNVWFADGVAGQGDVHTYRQTLYGNPDSKIPGPGMLEGWWNPDARDVAPDLVTDLTPRTAGLDSFLGKSAGGTWTLYVADVSAGASGKLDYWGLALLQASVPEPGYTTLGAGLGLGAFVALRRLRRRRGGP